MSKKLWLLVIFLIIVIGLLAAMYAIPGFDASLGATYHNYIFLPIIGATSAVVAHPIFQAWGYHIMYFAGGITVILLAWLLWPKLKPKMPTQSLTGLQDRVTSKSTVIPSSTAAQKQSIPKTETVEEAEVKTEA